MKKKKKKKVYETADVVVIVRHVHIYTLFFYFHFCDFINLLINLHFQCYRTIVALHLFLRNQYKY